MGTPSKPDGGIDLTYVEAAAREVGRILAEKKTYHLVVVKSTVVPGTTAGIVKDSLEMGSKKLFPKDFGLCFNPEFLREGTAIHDTLRPDALVIGAEDERSSETLLNLYKSFYGVDRVPDTLVTKIPNAEFVKYSVNTFRATQLSFLNSLANLCEKIPSADVSEVTKGLSVVTKIDSRYLRAGFGYGGSCLPKDLRALTALFQRLDVDSSLLLSVAEINQKQPLRAVEIAKQLVGDLRANRIAVLGLAFKAGTDDIRESVGVRIVVELLSLGARVNVYDPQALENAKHVFESSVEFAQSTKSCLRGAQCCIVATDWEEFRKIPPSIFKNEMRNPIIIDGCHVLDSKAFESSGVFVYEIGRNSGDQALRSTISPMIGNSLV